MSTPKNLIITSETEQVNYPLAPVNRLVVVHVVPKDAGQNDDWYYLTMACEPLTNERIIDIAMKVNSSPRYADMLKSGHYLNVHDDNCMQIGNGISFNNFSLGFANGRRITFDLMNLIVNIYNAALDAKEFGEPVGGQPAHEGV